MKLDKAEIAEIIRALDEAAQRSDAAAALGGFLSKLRRQMDDHAGARPAHCP